MTFPTTPLDVQADLSINGTWTSITSYVFPADGGPDQPTIVISRGLKDESPQVTPQTAGMRVDNRTYRFSPRNPTGAWYGKIGRNTPLRVHIAGPAVRLRLADDNTSNASAPSTTGLNVTGDLEARVDLQLANWSASTLASKWSPASGNFSWAFLLNADGTLSLWYSTDGSTITQAQSTAPLPWPAGRISLKVTYAHSSGNVAFYYATSIGGTYTQLGATVPTAGGLIFAGTGNVRLGWQSYLAGLTGYQGIYAAPPGQAWAPRAYNGMQGSVYEFQLRQGIGGTLLADPVFTAQTEGATSFADAQGNTWTCNGTAAITGRRMRFHGEVPEWPPSADVTGTDVWANIQASGILRRLQQRNPPLDSAFTRAWRQKTGTYAPIAYWPAEDGNQASATTLGLRSTSTSVPQQIASGLPNGSPMTISGRGTSFAANSDFVCSNSLPVPGTATWTGKIPAYTPPSNPANVVRFLLSVPSGGDTNNVYLARLLTTGGTCVELDLVYQTGGALALGGYDNAGNLLFSSGSIAFGLNGVPALVEMALTVSGGTITWHCNVLPVGASVQSGLSGTFSGTLGQMTTLIIAPTSTAVQSGIGQFTVQSAYAANGMDSATSQDALIGPLNAWAGETAGLRVARLCTEEGYAYRIVGPPAASVAMGPQTSSGFTDLLNECQAADHGILYEPRDALAIAYRTSPSMCNQAQAVSPPLSLAFAADQLGGGDMQPKDDDLLTVNDEIVTRGSGPVTGSTTEVTELADAFAADSSLSIQPPPNGVGLYQDSQTVNVWLDSQLGDQAGWLVHLGTCNEARYPVIPVDLADTSLTGIFSSVLDVDCGDYLQITDSKPWLGPPPIKQLAFGLTERLGLKTCLVQWATRPQSPYEVLTAGSGAASDCRADADGSTLHAGITSSAASMQVDTATGGRLWTTTAGDFPLDVLVGGERMTISAVSGTSSPQTFTISARSVNGVVKSHSAGEAVTVYQPCYAALV